MRIVPFSELRPTYGIGFSQRHLRRLIGSGQFPRPIRLSPRRIGWTDQAIEQWIAARATASRTRSPRTAPAGVYIHSARLNLGLYQSEVTRQSVI